jgi:hypothetical protein
MRLAAPPTGGATDTRGQQAQRRSERLPNIGVKGKPNFGNIWIVCGRLIYFFTNDKAVTRDIRDHVHDETQCRNVTLCPAGESAFGRRCSAQIVQNTSKCNHAVFVPEKLFIISSEGKRSGSFSTRPFIFVPLDSAEASQLPSDMSFRSKADRVIGQLQLKILGTEIKDDSSTRKARPLGCYLF